MRLFAEDKVAVALRELEEKRLRFANGTERPECMLVVSLEDGGMAGLCPNGMVVRVPALTSGEEFRVAHCTLIGRERRYVPADGMGGIFGFGKKGEFGFVLILRDETGETLRVPFVAGVSSCRMFEGNDPLTDRARRRGNTHPYLELRPIERSMLRDIEAHLERLFGTLPPITEKND